MMDTPFSNELNNILIPEQNDKIYYGESDTAYYLGKPIAIGGEGIIYSGTGGKAFKIYKKHRLTKTTIAKVQAMIEMKNDPNDNICWPETLIYEPSVKHIPVGYSMKNVNAGGKNIPTLERLINNPHYHGTNWNRRFLVRVCIRIVEAFEKLHKANIFMGDINPKNILVDKTCNVFFIDVDSYQFGEYLCPVGMPEYMSPELHNKGVTLSEVKRTLKDEQFAITTLIYRILFLNALPFPIDEINVAKSIVNYRFRFADGSTDNNDIYIWNNLTPELRKTFTDAYTEGIYVDETVWKKQLNQLYDWMVDDLVSDDLLINEAVDEANIGKQKFTKATCIECGIEYKKIEGKVSDSLCPFCKKDQKFNRRIISRYICKKCNKEFTVNPWDSVNADSENSLCPDCNENASFPPKNFGNTDFLKRQYEKILENLETKETEEYI